MKNLMIKPTRDFGDICPTYMKEFSVPGANRGTLTVTAGGCYEAVLNGHRVGEFVLAPGWTEATRVQFQTYDISHLLEETNRLEITVGRGWARSPLAGRRPEEGRDPRLDLPPWVAARIDDVIETDESWQVSESAVRFSEIYDGEIYDAAAKDAAWEAVEKYHCAGLDFIPQQGEEIREIERITPAEIFTTPAGETVVDFGQNLTGYVEIEFPQNTRAGTRVEISFAEVLDAAGNFYTENYRTAKSQLVYICNDGAQKYKPKFTFFGFRYAQVRLINISTKSGFEGKRGTSDVSPASVARLARAIVVHSDMKRTGWLECGEPLLNKFFDNVIWGQKGNFLDVPTDCPQRDERLGWTGDAQVFVKTAALNFDVEKFFAKWLADLKIAQCADGLVPHVVPDTQQGRGGSAAWGDAATICPWEIYSAYGDEKILSAQFESMCKWVDYSAENVRADIAGGFEGKVQPLSLGRGVHFGDWLSLELPPPNAPDPRRGATRHDFLAAAFCAHSAEIVVKAGEILGRDVSAYRALREEIAEAFRQKFDEPQDYRTQTEFILPLHFNLTKNPQAVADALCKKIVSDGNCLKTGFVGTPYILHVLSGYGHVKTAYDLLLRREYPSWLYPVTRGATTIWERWDSLKPDGSFQSANMNSFNHYAYGAVADWIYTVAAGITPAKPGYSAVRIAPLPDPRLGWLSARLDTRRGTIFSKWMYENDKIRYDIETPVPAEIIISGEIFRVEKGRYVFYGRI
ncbi:MAG: glycoside hydrolase family 78 protein [Defluviitaleaceae bacterium]|nr:glycoside hydrolase family 78 protein [Defluviitaleaceae bacterium]